MCRAGGGVGEHLLVFGNKSYVYMHMCYMMSTFAFLIAILASEDIRSHSQTHRTFSKGCVCCINYVGEFGTD